MRKYWIFLLWMAFLWGAAIGCGSHGTTVVTNPTPTPAIPSPTPTPIPTSGPSTPTNAWVVSGPAGGTITVLAADPSHPGTIWAGMAFGGTGALFKSINTGTTWTSIVTGSVADFSPVYDVNIPTSGAGNVINVIDGGAFVRSTDSGTTWQSSPLPGNGHGMAVSPFNRANILIAIPGKGVARSTDGGSTWTLLAGSPIIGSNTTVGVLHAPIVADLSSNGTYYLGTDQGLFVSTDSGATWTKNTTGFAAGDIAIRDIGTGTASPTTIYALAGTDSSSISDLYISSDHGQTWSALATGLDAERIIPDGVNSNTLWLSGLTLHAVYKSTDGGATFAASDGGMPQGAPSSSFIVSGPTGTFLPNIGTSFFAATQGFGVFRSQDGAATWSLSSSGISSWQGLAVVADTAHLGTLYLATSTGIFRSTTSAATWTRINNGEAFSVAVDPFDGTHLLAEFPGQGLKVSQDSGANWTAVTNLPTIPNGGSVTILAVSFGSSQGTIFVTTRGSGNVGVVRSTDGGATWAIVNAGLTNQQATSAVAVNPQIASMVFVGTDSGIFRSIDTGTSWSPVSASVVHAFSFDTKTNPLTMYADGLKSTDSGATFIGVPGTGSFLADPRAANAVFRLTMNIGSAQNMTWSRDGGATEIPFNKGLGQIITTQGFSGQAFVLLPNSPNETVCILSITHGLLCNSVAP